MEAESYIPVEIGERFRRQAWRVWAAGLAIVVGWALLIALPAMVKANGLTSISSPLYTFFSFICHQIDDRSFHIAGEKLGVCSRCFGVYFGIALGHAIYPLWRRIDDVEPLSKLWLFLSLIPIGVDWSLTVFGIWENTFASRFLTGTLLGAMCATYIVPATVEIVRNLTWRRAMSSGL